MLRGNPTGDFAPESRDTFPVVRISLPHQRVGAKNSRKKVAFRAAAFEERVDFQAFESENDQVIETNRLTNQHPHVCGAKFADGDVAEVISRGKWMKIPGKVAKLLALELHQCFAAIKIHARVKRNAPVDGCGDIRL